MSIVNCVLPLPNNPYNWATRKQDSFRINFYRLIYWYPGGSSYIEENGRRSPACFNKIPFWRSSKRKSKWNRNSGHKLRRAWRLHGQPNAQLHFGYQMHYVPPTIALRNVDKWTKNKYHISGGDFSNECQVLKSYRFTSSMLLTGRGNMSTCFSLGNSLYIRFTRDHRRWIRTVRHNPPHPSKYLCKCINKGSDRAVFAVHHPNYHNERLVIYHLFRQGSVVKMTWNSSDGK